MGSNPIGVTSHATMAAPFDRSGASPVSGVRAEPVELTVFAGMSPALPDPAAFGAVPIDNNASEREMKRIVLNRRNSLFVGNERGGRTAAILSGLTSTCRCHDIDPQRYLTQLLANLPATPASQLDRWLPDEWNRRDTPPPG